MAIISSWILASPLPIRPKFLLEMGLIPPLKGVYRTDLETPHLWSRFSYHPYFSKVEIQGILLSPIDHSIPGASAFETSSEWVAYTGDIRFHRKKEELSWQFVHQVSSLKSYILITEGTHIDRKVSIPEITVLEGALNTIKKTLGPIIADFATKDIERLLTFHQIAKESQSLLEILPKDAYLLETIRLLSQEIPDIHLDPIIWEEEVLVGYKDKVWFSLLMSIRSKIEYILCFSFLDINELISIKPQKGSLYIYSSSEPHDEGKLDLERLHNWIKHFEIRRMVREIKPKFLILTHTETHNYKLFKEALSGTGIELLVPEWDKEVRV